MTRRTAKADGPRIHLLGHQTKVVAVPGAGAALVENLRNGLRGLGNDESCRDWIGRRVQFCSNRDAKKIPVDDTRVHSGG